MPHTTTDEIEIFYEVTGEPGNPVIMLIPGGGAQLIAWRPEFCELLVAQGFRVVRMDNRDVGLSARFGGPDDVDGGYTLSDMADDVLRVLDDLGATAGHLVGHSMGAMIAQTAVLDHPDRVRSLGLLSSIPGQDPRYILHGERPELLVPPQRYSREEAVAGMVAFVQSLPAGRYPEDVEWAGWAAGEAYDRGYFPDGYTRQWAALRRAPERLERLRDVRVPTLVVHGRSDDVLHWVASVDIAEAIPDSELHVHPDMGHNIPAELWPDIVAGIARTAHHGEQSAVNP